MKILIHINSFGRGGAEKSTASFIMKIKERYPEFDFLCTYYYKFTPGFYEELEKTDIRLLQITEKNLLGRIKKFRSIISDYHPDIVHSILYEANIVSRLSSIGSNYISVESLVNKPYLKQREFQNDKIKYKFAVIKLIDKYTSHLVDQFHAVGQAVANHYMKVYDQKFEYTVVHRGRPIPKFNEQIMDEKKEKFTIITTARQEYQKGLIYLLKAVKTLNGLVKFQILGRKGAATPQLKKFINENEMENDVEFCGYLEDINPVVRNADLYVSASLFEGLPGSVIEAMSHRKPLLLSDIEEHREVAQVGENALFFTPGNVNEIVEGIKNFIDNPKMLKNFGSNSFKIFQEKFTEDAMVDGMVNFYKEIKN